jgi:hypothetical protein
MLSPDISGLPVYAHNWGRAGAGFLSNLTRHQMDYGRKRAPATFFNKSLDLHQASGEAIDAGSEQPKGLQPSCRAFRQWAASKTTSPTSKRPCGCGLSSPSQLHLVPPVRVATSERAPGPWERRAWPPGPGRCDFSDRRGLPLGDDCGDLAGALHDGHFEAATQRFGHWH